MIFKSARQARSHGMPSGKLCLCIGWIIALSALAVWARTGAPAGSDRQPIHLRLTSYASVPLPDGGHALVCPRGFYAWTRLSEPAVHLDLRAQRAVVFYDLPDSGDTDPNAPGALPTGIYLEGDVVLQADFYRGFQDNRFTADRAYYDPVRHTAVLDNAALRMVLQDQKVPLVVRARQRKQLRIDSDRAEDVVFANSDFYTPHVGLGVKRVSIVNARPAFAAGNDAADQPASFRMEDVQVRLEKLPIFWWPRTSGVSAEKPSPLLGVGLSTDNEFGVSLETDWDLTWLLGVQAPAGVDSRLRLDEYSKRGPGLGIETDYTRDDYLGGFKAYIQQDDGEDRLARIPSRKHIRSDTNQRGRIRWQHRQFLANDWQVSLELNYLSDEHYLESWHEREFDREKTPENLVYFKQQRNNWAIDLLHSFRLNNFEYALMQQPALGFHAHGQRLFDLLTWDHDGMIARVNESAGSRWVSGYGSGLEEWILPDRLEEETFTFGVSRHELALPFRTGPVNLAPTLIGTWAYDDSQEGPGHLFQGAAGLRASMTLWRVDSGVRSRLWDIDRVRHIVSPELSAFWVDSDQPDDPARPVLTVALNQRWQTRRGPRHDRATVDFFRWNTAVTLVENDRNHHFLPNRFSYAYPEPQYGLTPWLNGDLANFGLARRRLNTMTQADFIATDWLWQISDTTQLGGQLNYNLHDSEFSQSGVALSVERSPRLRYCLGHYFLKDGDPFTQDDGHYLSGGLGYRLTDKYTLAFTQQYDLAQSASNTSRATLIREFPHWFGAFSIGYDATRESMSFTFSVWPQGLGDWTLGQRKLSRLEP